jgi:hypothetical protein
VVNATNATISHNDLVTSNPPLVRLLTRSQVRSLLRWPELIEAIAQALIDASGGESAAAAASQLHLPGAALHLKSGALARPAVAAARCRSRNPHRASRSVAVANSGGAPAGCGRHGSDKTGPQGQRCLLWA